MWSYLKGKKGKGPDSQKMNHGLSKIRDFNYSATTKTLEMIAFPLRETNSIESL